MYIVYWKSVCMGWMPITNEFWFYWTAKRYVGSRVTDNRYSREYKIADQHGRLCLHVRRLAHEETE